MHIAELAGEHFNDTIKLSPINISGNESSHVHLAKCCNPIPGDSIKALIIKDQGIIIHRDTCNNILKTDPDTQLDASWDTLQANNYQAILSLNALDNHGLLASIAQAISTNGGDIKAVETTSKKLEGIEGFIEFRFVLHIKDLDQLNQIMRDLHSIPEIRRITRI